MNTKWYSPDTTTGSLSISKRYANGNEVLISDDHNVICSGIGVGIASMLAAGEAASPKDFKINLFQLGLSSQTMTSSLYKMGDPISAKEFGGDTNVRIKEPQRQIGRNKASIPTSGAFGDIPQRQIRKANSSKVEFTIVIDDDSCNNIKRDTNNVTISELGLYMNNPLNREDPEPILVAYRSFNPIYKTSDFSLVFRWSINFADYSNEFLPEIWWHPTGQAWNLIKNGFGLGPYEIQSGGMAGTVLDATDVLENVRGLGTFVGNLKDAPSQSIINIAEFMSANKKQINIETGGMRGHGGSACTYLAQAEKDLDKIVKPLINGGMVASAIVLRLDNCLSHCVSAPLGAEELRAQGATDQQAFDRHTETVSGISIDKNPTCGSAYSVLKGTPSSFVLAQMFLYMKAINDEHPGIEFSWDEGMGGFWLERGTESNPTFGHYPPHAIADERGTMVPGASVAAGNIKGNAPALFDAAISSLAASCTAHGVNFRSFIGDGSLNTILYANETPAAKLTGWSSLGELGWLKLASIRETCHENNIKFGVLLQFAGGICPACTNRRFCPDASFVSGTLAYYDGMVASGVAPDVLYPESWYCFPRADFVAETGDVSQQYIIQQLIDRALKHTPSTSTMVDQIKTEWWGRNVNFEDGICAGVDLCVENCSTDGTENSTWAGWTPYLFTEYLADIAKFHNTGNVEDNDGIW